MPLFRSRGIKVRIGKSEPHKMKIYYEPSEDVISIDPDIKVMAERFECLEYAISDGTIDAVNFHTDCKNVDDIIAEFDCGLILELGKIFDLSYRPYTIGYRLNGGKSLYFYPTVWKENRFGICGIKDTKTIEEQVNRFLSFVSVSDKCKNSISEQIPYITKFKGLCITNYHTKTSYKLYYRLSEEGICKIIKPLCNVEQYCDKYGEVVLSSVGILDGEIESYNFYFLR